MRQRRAPTSRPSRTSDPDIDGAGGGGPPEWRRLRRGIAIVFEDDDLLVVDKPVGIITADPASSGDGGRRSARAGNTVFDILKDHVRGQPNQTRRPASRGRGPSERGGHTRDQGVWIIHRLDKEASGLLVFAKSFKAFNWLKEDLRAKRMEREYMAVTEGVAGKPDETGTIQTFMDDGDPGNYAAPPTFRPPRSRLQVPQPDPNNEGKLAVTHFKVLAATAERTLVRVRLDTGRKNQIRIHFSDRGQPLVGDRKFGAKTDPLERLALHAASLSFNHPATGKPLTFESPAPVGFYRLVGAALPSVSEGPGVGLPSAPATEAARTQPAIPARADPIAIKPMPAPAPITPCGKPTHPIPPGQTQDRGIPLLGDVPDRRTPGRSPVPRDLAFALPLPPPSGKGTETSWDAVAPWYDELIEDRGNDHYDQVILPGALRLIEPQAGMKLLDVACGQGILTRRLASLGVESLGIEASPRLVQAAEQRVRDERLDRLARFRVGDARDLGAMGLENFDAAACIMALSNIEPIAPVFEGVARSLKPGGRFVWVITHPAFRAAGQTDWGWDVKLNRQYRRVDGYLSAGQKPIAMNPGKAARGEKTTTTWTFHRPLQTYIEAMSAAGLLVEKLEEWPSLRASTSGPRAPEENRARREIPLFLGVRAIRVARP